MDIIDSLCSKGKNCSENYIVSPCKDLWDIYNGFENYDDNLEVGYSEPLTLVYHHSDRWNELKSLNDQIIFSNKKPEIVPVTEAQKSKPKLPTTYDDEYPQYKPIYVLDASRELLMFRNVKFQRSAYALHCLHPNCGHFEPLSGLFTQQISLENFRLHVRMQHKEPSSKINCHYCHICGVQLDSLTQLVSHGQKLHSNFELPPALCEVCGDAMPKFAMVLHIISHKSEQEKQVAFGLQGDKKALKNLDITRPLHFPCQECGKISKSHKQYMHHINTHIPAEYRKHFNCDLCNKTFATLTLAENHKLQAHGPKKELTKSVDCTLCDKTFSTHEQFMKHLYSHKKDNESAKTNQSPPRDKKQHDYSLTFCKKENIEKDNSFTCEYCSNAFKTCADLKRHNLTCYPESVSKPILKGKQSSTPSFRDGKLVFLCEPCKRQFASKHNFMSHLNGRKHKVKFATKNDCPSIWTMEDELNLKVEIANNLK